MEIVKTKAFLLYSISPRTFLNNYGVGKKKKGLLLQSPQYQNESKRIKDDIVETTFKMPKPKLVKHPHFGILKAKIVVENARNGIKLGKDPSRIGR